MDYENILFWNVCGHNARSRRVVVAELVAHDRVSLLCLQETKLDVSDEHMLSTMLNESFQYASIPADGTRGYLGCLAHCLLVGLQHCEFAPLTYVEGGS
jgi:exonuclease III